MKLSSCFAFVVVAGDAHNVFVIRCGEIGVGIDHGLTLTLGVVNVLAEDPRDGAAGGCAVVLHERVTIGTVGERNIENLGVFERLLHAVPDRVIVVLGLNNSEREIRFVRENVVRLLRFTSLHRLTTNDNAAFRKVSFLSDLSHAVPLVAIRCDNCRCNKLGADVRLCESFFCS